ncbi:MAG: hypothetical protein HKN78_04825 [Sphingomonadaceae bacterium]|nr:hypothetical protein [Sphingomonadaceae bacterium]
MKPVPGILRKAPTIFYVLAALYFVGDFGLTVMDVTAFEIGYSETSDRIVRSELLRGFLNAAVNAAFLAANGVLFEILLAFWDRFAANDKADEE